MHHSNLNSIEPKVLRAQNRNNLDTVAALSDW
jgi:hypothetical protein